jgi:hypothetical protein
LVLIHLCPWCSERVFTLHSLELQPRLLAQN